MYSDEKAREEQMPKEEQPDHISQNRSSKRLDQLFANKNIQTNLKQLKQAILSHKNYQEIVQKHYDELKVKQIATIKQILTSKQFHAFISQHPDFKTEKQSFQTLFRNIDADTTNLQNLILNRMNIDEELAILEENLPKKIYRQIVSVVDSEEVLNYAKKQKHQQKLKKMREIFENSLIRTDVSQLIQALTNNTQISSLMAGYQDKMSGRQFKTVKQVLNSSQMVELLASNNRQENSQNFDQLFSHIKADLKKLKQRVLSYEDVSEVMKQCKRELKFSEFEQMNNIVLSDQFQKLYLSILQAKFKKMIRNLAHSQNDLIGIDTKLLAQKVLSKVNSQEIIQLYQPTSTGIQCKKIRSFLQSSSLTEIMKDYEIQEEISQCQSIFRKQGIKTNCHKLIQAFITNKSTQSILLDMEDDLTITQNKIIEKFIQGSQLQQEKQVQKFVNFEPISRGIKCNRKKRKNKN